MAKARTPRKRNIENYAHKGKERVNNPPVGLVTPQTDRDAGHRGQAVLDTRVLCLSWDAPFPGSHPGFGSGYAGLGAWSDRVSQSRPFVCLTCGLGHG